MNNLTLGAHPRGVCDNVTVRRGSGSHLPGEAFQRRPIDQFDMAARGRHLALLLQFAQYAPHHFARRAEFRRKLLLRHRD